MKFVCLGYIAPEKLEGMTREEQENMFDTCFSYDDVLREGETSPAAKRFKALRRLERCAGNKVRSRSQMALSQRPRSRSEEF